MSTRLSNGIKSDVEDALLNQLNNGVRFIDCPLTIEEQHELWIKFFPTDLVEAVQKLADHQCQVDYSFMDKTAAFHLSLGDDALHEIRFVNHASQRTFFQTTPKMRQAFPPLVSRQENERVVRDMPRCPVLNRDNLAEFMGEERATAIFEWSTMCVTMDAEIESAKLAVTDIFAMIKTAGQLKRMVPDLFKYIPDEQRRAFEDQKRASTLPFEWAGYDRSRVDAMIGTLLKCQLLEGITKPRMKDATHGGEGFNWAKLHTNVVSKD